MPALEEDSGKGTEKNLVGTHLEAISIRALTDFLLEAQVCLDILEFGLDVGMFGGEREETVERDGGLSISMSLYEVTWGLWEDEHADDENASPDELDGNGDTVRAIVVAVLGRLIDN